MLVFTQILSDTLFLTNERRYSQILSDNSLFDERTTLQVRKAEMDLKNAQKRLAVSKEEEKEALNRILDSVYVDRDMVSSPLQSQKELYKKKL